MVWEIRKQGKNRYKSLTKSQCEAIETDHQRYEHEKAIGKRTQAHRHILVEYSSSNKKPIGNVQLLVTILQFCTLDGVLLLRRITQKKIVKICLHLGKKSKFPTLTCVTLERPLRLCY